MIAKKTGSYESDIPTTPTGVYHAVNYGVVGVGTHQSPFKDKNGEDQWFNQVVLLFELPFETIEIDGNTMPRGISTFRMTISLHEKANLRKFLEAWRGVPFAEEELTSGFDLKKLLCKNCQISVVHNKSGEKTYANIGAIMPLAKGTEAVDPFNEPVYYEIDKGMLIPDTLPEWLKIKIFESREMRGHSKPDETGQQNDFPTDKSEEAPVF